MTGWRVLAVALLFVCLLQVLLAYTVSRRPRRGWGWELWGSAETRRARADWRALPHEIRDAVLDAAALGEPDRDPSIRAVATAWADAVTGPRWALAWIGEAVPWLLGWSLSAIGTSLIAGRDPTGHLISGAIVVVIATPPRLGLQRWRARRVQVANRAPGQSYSRTLTRSL